MNSKLILGLVWIAVGSVSDAIGADITLFPAQSSMPSSWSGIYVGGGVGTKKSDANWTSNCFGPACESGGVNFFSPDDSSPRSFGKSSFRGSLYAGFNWQMSQWVVGIEADLGLGSISKRISGIPGCTTNCGGFPPTPANIDSSSFAMQHDWSLRGRVGYLLLPNVLAYVTGGVASQRVEASLTCSFAGPWCFPPIATDIRNETQNATLRGWIAGGGLEWMINDHWLWRMEYRYADFGHFRPVFFGGTADVVVTDIRLVTHTTTFGVAFKF